jgi:two-component system, NarL family, sensor kinase
MDYSSKIEFIVIIGTSSMLLLACFIILFLFLYQKKRLSQELKMQKVESEYQNELLVATVDIQESERKRIALDLHDNIGSMLSAIRLRMYQLNKSTTDETLQESYKETTDIIDDMLETTRSFSRELMSPTLEDFGLAHALENLCTRIHTGGVLHVDIQVVGEYKRQSLKTELNIFRIAQEILNNIVKHAHASEIRMVLVSGGDMLELRIEDNGDGFIKKEGIGKQGLGLKSIQTRLHLLKATLNYFPGEVKGTIAIIKVPVQK